MKRKLLAICMSAMLVVPTSVQAYDTWGCAIWLCLPVGFSYPECGKARRAMLKRMYKFKSLIPSFSSCEVAEAGRTNRNKYRIGTDTAILMGPYIEGYKVVQPVEKIIEGGFCNFRDTGHEEPRGCITTLQLIRVYENGVQKGMTYYRNKEGEDYIRDPVTGVLSVVPEQQLTE